MSKIKYIKAREILDSRGNPTIEADVVLENGMFGRAQVPSGASTGIHEALELRDGDKDAYHGKGVSKAVKNVNKDIFKLLKGKDVLDQKNIDDLLIDLDGTENKSNLGANAILAVSIAVCKVASIYKGIPIYKYIHEIHGKDTTLGMLPVPMINVLNGGKHADKSTDIQEFMIMPVGAKSFREAIKMSSEIYQTLKGLIKKKGYATQVGDEGGFAPSLSKNSKALDLLSKAVDESGYKLGDDIAFAIDAAASEFYENGKYFLRSENKKYSSKELNSFYLKLLEKYPLISLEDTHDQDDWDGFVSLTSKIGERVQMVGDDIFVTNVKKIQKGIEMGAANSVLIKLNQIGTVTETIDAVKLAQDNGWTCVISHRSGETEDTFIADFVVGLGTGMIKTGSVCRGERICKYNQLLRIEEELGNAAIYASIKNLV